MEQEELVMKVGLKIWGFCIQKERRRADALICGVHFVYVLVYFSRDILDG